MVWYSIKSRRIKSVKWYGFSLFARKYKKQILDKGLGVSKKVVHKADEFTGDNIADKLTKSNDNNNF